MGEDRESTRVDILKGSSLNWEFEKVSQNLDTLKYTYISGLSACKGRFFFMSFFAGPLNLKTVVVLC